MNKLKAIILDDEQTSIDSLLWELDNFKERVEVSETFTDVDLAKSFLEKHKIDVIFLDVEMPKLNGFEWLKQFQKPTFKVIFTTAYDQFALKAFEVNAYDYLMKPVDEDELLRAINKVDQDQWHDELERQITTIVNSISSLSKRKNIAVPTNEGLEFIEIENIIRCASESNYTYIYTLDEKPLLVSKTLKEITILINSDHFFRIHHSHLINLHFLKKYRKGKAGSVILKDGTQIPVSRSRKGDFLDEI